MIYICIQCSGDNSCAENESIEINRHGAKDSICAKYDDDCDIDIDNDERNERHDVASSKNEATQYLHENKLDFREQLEQGDSFFISGEQHLRKTAARKTKANLKIKNVNAASSHLKSSHIGKANFLEDFELVEILKQPPKSVPELKTKSNYQTFFNGIAEERMRRLLEAAYFDIQDDEARSIKVEKRLHLLKEAMS